MLSQNQDLSGSDASTDSADPVSFPEGGKDLDAATFVDAPAESAIVDGSRDAQPDSSAAVDASDDAPDALTTPIPYPCTPEVADESLGVFVDQATGTDTASCGSLASPCKSIVAGNIAARRQLRKWIYIGPGIYNESVEPYVGVGLKGAWTVSTNGWHRDCATAATPNVRIRGANAAFGLADGAVAVFINGGAAPYVLDSLVIEASARTPPLQISSFGLIVDQNSVVTLNNVFIRTMDGVAGAPGSTGGSGANGSNCSMGNWDGLPGVAGAPGAGATPGRVFIYGYLASAGDAGSAGTPGDPGIPGTPRTCVWGAGRCMVTSSGCELVSTFTSCGDPGTAGCGGGAGAPGGGGQSGGASIALVVGDSSTLVMNGGELVAANGGDGGDGGDGGNGGDPTDGTAGVAGGAALPTSCAYVANVCTTTSTSPGGVAGGAGGRGGAGPHGSRGGGGAGGPSYAYATSGTATVTLHGTVTRWGTGGRGGAGGNPGAPGAAQEHN